jgi:hypothetical protein
MGRKKQHREEFFRLHPNCCFCGGAVLAAEEDHFPARALFVSRVWPEGLVFPACAECNRATSRDEQLISVIARGRAAEKHWIPDERKEFQRRFDSVRRDFPGLLEGMRDRVSLRDRRRVRDSLQLEQSTGSSLLNVPVMSLDDDRIRDAFLNIGRKLGLAFYYKHFERIMPPAGGVATTWYSNVKVEQGLLPREFSQLAPHVPNLSRGAVDLSDQFFYTIGIDEEDGVRRGTYVASFFTTFLIVGFMRSDRATFPQVENNNSSFKVFAPYRCE